MLDYSQVREIADQQTRKARHLHKRPKTIRKYTGQNFREFIRTIPFLGDYVAEGWERDEKIEPLFVDKSGYGADDEPALSLNQFKRKLDSFLASGDNFGFGIIEEGEFQIYIAVYRPDHRDFTHTGSLTNDELNRIGSTGKL